MKNHSSEGNTKQIDESSVEGEGAEKYNDRSQANINLVHASVVEEL